MSYLARHCRWDLLCSCIVIANPQIIQTLVTDIEPDSKVRVAMNEINAAVRQRAAALEKAEAGAQAPI